MLRVKYFVSNCAQLVLVMIKRKGHCGWSCGSQGPLESLDGGIQPLGSVFHNPRGGHNPVVWETMLLKFFQPCECPSLHCWPKSVWPLGCLVPVLIKPSWYFYSCLARKPACTSTILIHKTCVSATELECALQTWLSPLTIRLGLFFGVGVPWFMLTFPINKLHKCSIPCSLWKN